MGLEIKINCLNTDVDPERHKVIAEGNGKTKELLNEKEPFVEINAYNIKADREFCEKFGTTLEKTINNKKERDAFTGKTEEKAK